MKRPELLAIMLKVLGFWSLISGISGLPRAISFSHKFADELEFMLMMAYTFAGPSIAIVASWFLIRSTNWFVEIACPRTDWTADEDCSERSRELLGGILVAVGYWEILNGLVRLPYEFANTYGTSLASFDGIAYSGITIVAGCFLVFASDRCVQFAYRRSGKVSDGDVVDPER